MIQDDKSNESAPPAVPSSSTNSATKAPTSNTTPLANIASLVRPITTQILPQSAGESATTGSNCKNGVYFLGNDAFYVVFRYIQVC